MASKRVLWNKVGRYFSAIVIAAFFLPFFGVSCDGIEVITVSGADMVGGCKPGGMIAEAEKEEGRQRKRHSDDGEMDGGGGGGMKGGLGGHVDNVEREPLAIVAMVLAIAGFAAAWMRNKKGMLASFGIAIVTIGVLVGLWIKVGGTLKEAVDKEALGKSGGGRMTKDVKIDAGGRYGLWLSGLMLLGIAGITGRALREPENAPSEAPPIAPPPIAPPV
ncbi:MAG: hypothetical protein IPQ07_09890 [Myxococcales bacterium]|nr:hypothetical protein [Myxococcales bacterium]